MSAGLVDPTTKKPTGVKIGTYSWDCPYLSPTNTSTWSPGDKTFVVQQSGANLSSGALGTVTLDIAKK